MSTDHDDDDRPPGAGSLDVNGRFERLEPGAARHQPPEPGQRAARPADEPLELARTPQPRRYEEPQPYRTPPPPPRRYTGWLLAGLLLVVVAAIGAGVLVTRRRAAQPGVRALSPVENLLHGGASAALVVDSDPPGAEIRIEGRLVGVTPWAGDNGWRGEVMVELTKPGYQPWRGIFTGGHDTNLHATLRRQ